MRYITAIIVLIGISLAVCFGLSGMLLSYDSSFSSQRLSKPRSKRNPQDWPQIGSKANNIFWVVQISDIHMSVYEDPARAPDLIRLCEEYLSIINPDAVLVTGDLTNGKINSGFMSRQIQDEWLLYENVQRKCSAMFTGRWLDLRGNHDCFDVYDSSSSNNFFSRMSATGPAYYKDKTSQLGFIHNIEKQYGSYSFVGLDTCMRPGPNRPFNFFGYLTETQARHLQFLSEVTSVSNQTVWFGHFPTSVTVHDKTSLRDIMSESILYVCGHLHTLGNTVPKMHARQKTGQLELELGDWKDNRVFRIIAFDHDLVSVADAKLGEDPFIIVTNPKNNQYLSPTKEPFEMIASSTHIRILVFSKKKVVSVKVHINRHYQGEAQPAGSHLYVLRWDPSIYNKGSHKIVVTVVEADKTLTLLHNEFSVDGTVREFDFVSRFLLMTDIYTLGKVTFNLLVLIYVLVLVCMRQCSNIRPWYFKGTGIIRTFFNSLLVKVWLASRIDRSFYGLIGTVLYLTFGPWFVGYLLHDRVGVVFAWGIIISNNFHAGGLTYFYGIYQLIAFNVPLVICIGHMLDLRRKYGQKLHFVHHKTFATCVSLFFLSTAYLAFGPFRWAYGWLTVILGPLRTGNLLLLPVGLLAASRVDVREALEGNEHF